jgi:hypothetical protein
VNGRINGMMLADDEMEESNNDLPAMDHLQVGHSFDRNKQLKDMPTTTQHTHQDKRYTGAEGEVRCSATTTRGRSCAYTCVSGTNYCYLHSDYDTNPPPRRWSHKGKSESCINITNSNNSVVMAPFVVEGSNENSLKGLERLPAVLLVPNSSPSVTSEGLSRIPSPSGTATSEKLPSAKRSRRTTSTKLAAMHADSPFPPLSMISTDQWYHKLVRIANGHLAGRVGRVEKWGNGWVSVDVPGVGLHMEATMQHQAWHRCTHQARASTIKTNTTGGKYKI